MSINQDLIPDNNPLGVKGKYVEDDRSNDGIFALAAAVSDGQQATNDANLLTIEETGAAEELLALASEASLTSPIDRDNIHTPEYDLEENLSTRSQAKENSEAKENSSIRAQAEVVCNTSGTGSRKHVCSNCNATSTPFWRKYSDGNYYCNACGLYLRTHNMMRPLSLSKNREARRSKMRPESCGNCGATDTPMWRKTEDGLVVCNACGLYHKLHGQHRKLGAKRGTSAAIQGNGVVRSGPTDFKLVPHDASKLINKSSPPVVKKESETTSLSSAAESPDSSSSSSDSSPNSSGKVAKYSLDNQFHHKFDPSRLVSNSNNSITGNPSNLLPSVILPIVVEPQPVDSRKLAYLKCSQGRTALIAPKLSLPPEQLSTSPNNHNLSINPSPSPAMPPILSDFINSLASTSPENLTSDQVEHPLQPLLTSIVSQKLKEQKLKYVADRLKNASPMLQSFGNPENNVNNLQYHLVPPQNHNHNHQNHHHQQQGGYNNNSENVVYYQNGQEGWPNHSHNPNNQLNDFIQDQQDAIQNDQMQMHHLRQLQQMQQIQNQYLANVQNQPMNNYNYTIPEQVLGNSQNYNNNMNQPRYETADMYQRNYLQQQQQQQLLYYQQQQQLQFQILQQQQQQHQQQHPHNLPTQQYQQQFFVEQFPELPARQMSPFSSLKFDKNLIDLVNLQFWQDSNSVNGSSLSNNNGSNQNGMSSANLDPDEPNF